MSSESSDKSQEQNSAAWTAVLWIMMSNDSYFESKWEIETKT